MKRTLMLVTFLILPPLAVASSTTPTSARKGPEPIENDCTQRIFADGFERGNSSAWGGEQDPYTCIQNLGQTGTEGEHVTLRCQPHDGVPHNFCKIWADFEFGIYYIEEDCTAEHEYETLEGCVHALALCEPIAPSGPFSNSIEVPHGDDC